jgi:hypothetical protein
MLPLVGLLLKIPWHDYSPKAIFAHPDWLLVALMRRLAASRERAADNAVRGGALARSSS